MGPVQLIVLRDLNWIKGMRNYSGRRRGFLDLGDHCHVIATCLQGGLKMTKALARPCFSLQFRAARPQPLDFFAFGPQNFLQPVHVWVELKLLESDANGCNLPLPRRSS